MTIGEVIELAAFLSEGNAVAIKLIIRTVRLEDLVEIEKMFVNPGVAKKFKKNILVRS